MPWRMHLLILIAVFSLNHAKEEKKTALIITVDELKPEESDVIISDLTIKQQRNMPSYQRKERSYASAESVPLEKHLDYILVRPEDLKVLKNLEDVTVAKPKFVKYPDSSSGEIYENDGYSEYPEEKKSYVINSGYPRSPSSQTTSGINKYPSRPAPPLTTYSDDDQKRNIGPNDSPYVHKNYHGYASPGYSYNAPYSSNSPKVLGTSGSIGPSNGPSPSNSYTGPSSYSGPSNTYESSKPISYSGTSSYSAPGSSKSTSYSDPSSYEKSKQPYSDSPYTKNEKSTYYSRPSSYSAPDSSKSKSYSTPSSYGSSKSAPHSGAEKSPQFSGPSSYTHPTSYENSKPSSYSGTSSYDTSKPSYSGPSSYDTSKPSYSDPSTYENSMPSSYSGPSSYESSKPSSYSRPSTYENTRPSSYSGPSSYGSSKPSSYYASPNYGRSKPNSYSGSSSYPGSGSIYDKSKPDSYSTISTYSGPESSHSSSKPHYSGPSSYSSQSSPQYDSSIEKYTNSEKYTSHPESYDQHKTQPYHDYNPSKSLSDDSSYEIDSDYTPPNKPYKSGYYNSPSVTVEPAKHISYDDLPSTYSNSHSTDYDSHHSTYKDDLPYDTPKDTHDPPSSKSYIPPESYNKDNKYISYGSKSFSNPTYGRKTNDGFSSSANTKPGTPYNSNFNSDSYDISVSPKEQYPRKHSHSSIKTSYGTEHGTPYYEEPVKKYNTQYYPPSYRTASEVSYVPPSSSYKENNPRAPNQKYEDSVHSKPNVQSGHYSTYDSPPVVEDDINYKSSPILSKHSSHYDNSPHNDKSSPLSYYKNPSSYSTHSNLEYGARYPTTYRKTRHTDSKISSPALSKFTLEDARSPDHVETYKKRNPETGLTETHSHYHHYHDHSTEIPDTHSAKKNYSPVRPAPLHDELEQPRHPPLPRRSKSSKKYYNSEEDHSKESVEDYKTHPRYSNAKTYSPSAYNSEYRDSDKPSYTHSDAEINYPASSQNKNYHYSDHSSEETDDEPRIYTKTTTTTYTKPYKEASNEHGHKSDYNSDNSYKQPDFSKKNIHGSKVKDFETSQPEYSRPNVHRGSQMFSRPFIYSRSKPYTSEAKSKDYITNTTLPITYSSLSEILPPKRVEGVVYRSRQSYPHVKSFKSNKSYLPYKPRLSKSSSSYDYKLYESLPSEVSQKNVTKDRSEHVITKLVSIQSKKAPPKKRLRYASIESSDESKDSSEDSNLDAIPGDPGKDYPVLKEIPHNGFTCENKLPGFYADVENRCQVYYQCSEEGRLQSFLCPNGTIFNQLTFVCEWWHNVDCSKSEKYFSKNNLLYKSAPPQIKKKRTVREKYVRPSRPETRANYNLESYYSDNSQEFNRRKNGRRRRQSAYANYD